MLQTFLPTGLVTWGEIRYQGEMKWPVEARYHKSARPSVMAVTTSNHGERQNLEPFLNIQRPRLRLSYER